MSQCVPNWNVEDDHPRPVDRAAAPRQPHRSTAAPLHHLPMLEYQVAELTWENGQLGMHGHGLRPPRQKPSGGGVVGGCNGTLESIVKQATCKGGSLLFDAMVPCSHSDQADHRRRGAGSDTVATVPVATDWEPSLSGSATFGRDRKTVDSYDDLGGGFTTSTSLGSAAKTTTADDRDSVSLSLQSSRVQRGGKNNNNVKEKRGPYDETGEVEKSKESSAKFSVPTKRGRAAAIHNQSERKRRDKINQRMKTLQKLVPNSSKTDKASMLDEVIDYLKQLQAQVQMMSRFNFTPMMQQMPIMTPMGITTMGMGMGMGMFDMATARPNPLPFIPITPAQAQAQVPADRTPSLMPDPLLSFLASQAHQPMTMDAYRRLQAAIYQQMQQNPPPSSSNN